MRAGRSLVALLVAACLGSPVVAVHSASPVLDFTLPLAEGGHWRLAEQRGHEVWIALVAPYCGDCTGFVDAAAARMRELEGAAAMPTLMVISTLDARGAPLQLEGAVRNGLLVDRNDAVLRMLDPPELPWLVRIDADGRAVAAGSDLDSLAPIAPGDGLWNSLVSRWRQVWDE